MDNKIARMEWFCEHAGITRVFPSDDCKHGDDYELALAFKIVERFKEPDENGFLGRVEYMGLCGKISLSQMRAIKVETYRNKWYIRMTRWKNGEKKTVNINYRLRNNK